MSAQGYFRWFCHSYPLASWLSLDGGSVSYLILISPFPGWLDVDAKQGFLKGTLYCSSFGGPGQNWCYLLLSFLPLGLYCSVLSITYFLFGARYGRGAPYSLQPRLLSLALALLPFLLAHPRGKCVRPCAYFGCSCYYRLKWPIMLRRVSPSPTASPIVWLLISGPCQVFDFLSFNP